MELISQYSLRPPTIIPLHYKTSSNFKRVMTTTATKYSSNFPSKCFPNKFINLPMGLYGENKFSKFLSFCQSRHDSIPACAQVDPANLELVFAKVIRFGSACYKFTLPYSMHHAIVAATCLFVRVLVENPQLFKWSLIIKAFPGLIAVIFAHTYNNGLNQVFDIDIDRVNKPYLPIPSGELSLKQAQLVLTFVVIGGLLILRLMNADLITTAFYCAGLLLTTSYSTPPFRFKRSSIATAIVLPLIGFVMCIGIPYTTRASLGLPFFWSPSAVFIAAFSIIFLVVICITKDITDVEGDMKYDIRTFAARFGGKNVAIFGIGMLLVDYIGAMAAAIYMPQAFKSHIMLPAHSILALLLLFQARKLDKANYAKEASANFYKFLWKINLFEFVLFPFI